MTAFIPGMEEIFFKIELDGVLVGIESNIVSEIGEEGHLLESLILAHHCAGVDVFAAPYLEGCATAIESFVNNAD